MKSTELEFSCPAEPWGLFFSVPTCAVRLGHELSTRTYELCDQMLVAGVPDSDSSLQLL